MSVITNKDCFPKDYILKKYGVYCNCV